MKKVVDSVQELAHGAKIVNLGKDDEFVVTYKPEAVDRLIADLRELKGDISDSCEQLERGEKQLCDSLKDKIDNLSEKIGSKLFPNKDNYEEEIAEEKADFLALRAPLAKGKKISFERSPQIKKDSAVPGFKHIRNEIQKTLAAPKLSKLEKISRSSLYPKFIRVYENMYTRLEKHPNDERMITWMTSLDQEVNNMLNAAEYTLNEDPKQPAYSAKEKASHLMFDTQTLDEIVKRIGQTMDLNAQHKRDLKNKFLVDLDQLQLAIKPIKRVEDKQFEKLVAGDRPLPPPLLKPETLQAQEYQID